VINNFHRLSMSLRNYTLQTESRVRQSHARERSDFQKRNYSIEPFYCSYFGLTQCRSKSGNYRLRNISTALPTRVWRDHLTIHTIIIIIRIPFCGPLSFSLAFSARHRGEYRRCLTGRMEFFSPV